VGSVQPVIELESLDAFDAYLDGHKSLTDVACQGLDLRERSWRLFEADVREAFFLGCQLEGSALEYLNGQGACVFPAIEGLPFRSFRGDLYDAAELYAGYVPGEHESYQVTPDARSYREHKRTTASLHVVATLAERIHDHAVDNALHQHLAQVGPESVVAIMGGHGLTRTNDAYIQVARLGRALTAAGFYVATGGGPGAMEAANFGAWMAAHPPEALDHALSVLAGAATFEPVGEWLDAAFEVRSRWPQPEPATGSSLGVPTWHYGHEPPNVFATEIAKYFANSIREDGLLAIALAGVVFAPGSAGTIQEVFQDAAQNHYESFAKVSPMVFLDVEYWTTVKPIYPVLQDLAAGMPYGDVLAAFDEIEPIIDFLTTHR
jgi:predicted Rossmann-fold nucleotide-binding protein